MAPLKPKSDNDLAKKQLSFPCVTTHGSIEARNGLAGDRDRILFPCVTTHGSIEANPADNITATTAAFPCVTTHGSIEALYAGVC